MSEMWRILCLLSLNCLLLSKPNLETYGGYLATFRKRSSSVSAARGLSMGLTIPAIGVDGFASRAACVPKEQPVGVPAPQDKIYVADPAPRLIQRAEKPDAVSDVPPAELAAAIARLAAQSEDTSPPAPLYVRTADAAPSRDGPPVMLD